MKGFSLTQVFLKMEANYESQGYLCIFVIKRSFYIFTPLVKIFRSPEDVSCALLSTAPAH